MTEAIIMSILESAEESCATLIQAAEEHRRTQINYASEQRILTNATYSAQEDFAYELARQCMQGLLKKAVEKVRQSSDLDDALRKLENL